MEAFLLMRIIPFIVGIVITLALIFALNKKWGSIPALGKFLSPQQGFWQNAEPTDANMNEEISFKGLKGKANVYLDDRLVPHVFAQNEEDVYFIQGYLHAKYRLWQMEFQTIAAAGRVSEFLGNDPRFIRYDREQRRLGMVYAAENALRVIDADEQSKQYFDAYTHGVNAYINSLSESKLPVEYKLLGYKPEQWSNLKCALFLKMMSKDLAGYDRDLEFTNEKSVFSLKEMKLLYPEVSDSSHPIIPKGTAFDAPGIVPVKPATADSLYFGNDTTLNVREVNKPNPHNGSNNWAVSGSKTKSGAPILCNDPHLGLTLPSIWYEMQLSTPTMNVYGASFPGSPSVIIGFNDNIAFGFTNAMRDVKDYYQIRFKDDSKKEYWFNGKWEPTDLRIEEIKICGAATLYDTVAYTSFGPVMYDQSFTVDSTNNTAIAVRWSAHDPSNEGAMWFKLDRAKNYDDYLAAIKDFNCPGQNMLFASKSGDIAIWQQAKFPARWQEQGLYLMPGEDSSYSWQGYIPQNENPHIINPPEGFIESANQRPVDSAYPYFIPGNYISARGIRISNRLQQMQQITVDDMKQLQTDYYSPNAADFVPFLLKNVDETSLSEKERYYLQEVKSWDFYVRPDSKAATIYQAWMDSLKNVIWDDEFLKVKGAFERPDEQTLIEALLKDSAFQFVDNVNTSMVETIDHQVTLAFKVAAKALTDEEAKDGLLWWKHKNSSIYHLLKTAVLPFARTGLHVGGWNNTVNAITHDHGPSWRMIVQLTNETEAYGIYPGGQSGNPGSKFYDNFVSDWAAGKYYTLWMMKESEANDKRIIGKLSFTNF
ncbi:MAG: penicillin acylase family protein [Flavisolibacter sp.]